MKEYKFISRENEFSCTIIELFRGGMYEYFVETPFTSDLYFCFGSEEQFTEKALYCLWFTGYFDHIILDAKKEL